MRTACTVFCLCLIAVVAGLSGCAGLAYIVRCSVDRADLGCQ